MMTTFLGALLGALVGTVVTHYTGVRMLLNKLLEQYGITPK